MRSEYYGTRNQWYEAAAVEEPALGGAVQPASAYSPPPASACWAAFGWAPPPGERRRLQDCTCATLLMAPGTR